MALTTSAALGLGAATISAGSAIAGGIGASNARGASLKNTQALIQSAQGNAANIFGTKIKPVDYTPLNQTDPGYRSTAADAIRGDQANLPISSKLSADTNAAITASAKARATGWDPTLMASLGQLYQNRGNELAGNIPYADAMQSMMGTNRAANDAGGAGTSTPQVAADLGISRLSLMNQGASLSSQIESILNGIDPVSAQTHPQDYQINPSQYASSAIADNQFGAQFKSQQNAIRAMADPGAAGIFNAQMMLNGMQGQQGVANANMWGGIGQQVGASMAGFGRALAPPAMTGYGGYGALNPGYNNSTMNYQPSVYANQQAAAGGYNPFTGNGIDNGSMVSEGAAGAAGV